MSENIIYEDDAVILCQKRAGIAVETAKIGEIDMVSQLRNDRYEKSNNSYIGLVHRLGQPVEGLVLFGKNQAATAALSQQISQRKMRKYYLAVICGYPKQKEEKLVDYLLKNTKTNISTVVNQSVPRAKKSELSYRILQTNNELSLAEIELFTGRHHQIRIQMANAGLPLLGDAKYNKQRVVQKGESLALCAYRLIFRHPFTKKEMMFEIIPQNAIFKEFDFTNDGLTNEKS